MRYGPPEHPLATACRKISITKTPRPSDTGGCPRSVRTHGAMGCITDLTEHSSRRPIAIAKKKFIDMRSRLAIDLERQETEAKIEVLNADQRGYGSLSNVLA